MIARNLQFSWLRSREFDLTLMLFPMLIAVASAMACVQIPWLFAPLIVIDLWLLGYHHVISTYTRIAFDRDNASKHRFLVFVLPWIVLAATVSLAIGFGAWIIASVYLYWQWFHYTRQSYGISRFYLGRAGHKELLASRLHTWALYAIPVTGILYRSYQAPEKFLFMDLWVFPTPFAAVALAGAVSFILISMQLAHWVKLYRCGDLPGCYALYILSHHFMFAVGYLLIEDINFGWLAVNMWHNAQYILFVWLQNNRTYANGIDPQHRLISRISQDGRIFVYLLVCIGITLAIYLPILAFAKVMAAYTVIPMVIVLFMALNFHHYVVDAVIWRRKKAANNQQA